MTRPEKVLIPLIFAVMTFLPAAASAALLHFASYEGEVEVVKILLDAGGEK